MRLCSSETPLGFSAVPEGSGEPSMNCGVCQVPESTAAATMAMDSGLIWTLPWPMVSAARAATPAADGTDPEKAGTGREDQSDPMPKAFTTWSNWPVVRRSESPAKAVPQPSAKSSLKDLVAPVASLVKVCPPTVKEFSQEIWVPALTPVPSNAAADTMVNTLPGVSLALSASAAGAPDAWRGAPASPPPVDAWP